MGTGSSEDSGEIKGIWTGVLEGSGERIHIEPWRTEVLEGSGERIHIEHWRTEVLEGRGKRKGIED